MSFSLESLNDALGEGYEQRVDELVVELLETRYLPYYRRALSTFSFDEPLVSLSRLARQLRPGRGDRARDDALLLYHNIFIESHRYVVQRALKRLYL